MGSRDEAFTRRKRVAYEITTECICCGACQSECPVEVISEGDDVYRIDAALCTACGACAAICPVGAIREIGS
jgi:ferredoxin